MCWSNIIFLLISVTVRVREINLFLLTESVYSTLSKTYICIGITFCQIPN